MRFYRLSVDAGKHKRFAWVFPPYDRAGKIINCSICGQSWLDVSGMYSEHLSYPVTFVGNNFADLICGGGGDDLISYRLKCFLESVDGCYAKFVEMPIVKKSDFSEEELKAFRRRGYDTKKFHDETPLYYRMDLEVGANLHIKSNYEWVDSGSDFCKFCGYGVGYKLKDYLAPYYIDKKTWNGSPLFRLRELGLTNICTEEFKSECEKNGFSGMQFDEVQAII